MHSIRVGLAAMVVLLALAVVPPARAQSEQQVLVDKATTTALAMKADERLEQLRKLVQSARGVVIVPALVKAGFIIGGAGGAGVFVGRDPATNTWSDPAFVDLGAASIGVQAGAEVAEVVIVIMSERAMNALLASRVTLSAEAGLVVGVIGGEREAGTTTNIGADIYAFSRSKGLFGGLSIEGAVIISDEDWNAAYYGQAATTRQIVIERKLANPAAQKLKNALAELSAAPL